jgi:hypothetical protein
MPLAASHSLQHQHRCRPQHCPHHRLLLLLLPPLLLRQPLLHRQPLSAALL